MNWQSVTVRAGKNTNLPQGIYDLRSKRACGAEKRSQCARDVVKAVRGGGYKEAVAAKRRPFTISIYIEQI